MSTFPRAHVVIVVPTLRPAGAERVAATVAGALARAADVTVVTYDPRGTARSFARAPLPWAASVPDGCSHAHLAARGAGPVRLVVLVVRLASWLRRTRPDAVVSFLTYSNVLVVLARLLLVQRPLHVASEHAMAESLGSDGAGLRRLARILPLLYRLPDALVVVADAVGSSLVRAGIVRRPERLVTIPNPVDVPRLLTLAEQGHELDARMDDLRGRGPVVLCVARLHEDKDHDTLLRSLALLPASVSLVLIGDGPRRRWLERRTAQLGLETQVIFAGQLSNPYAVMRRADVVVLPSVAEGFGLVALEATALGVPFIGTNVGGLGEVCRMLGHLTFPAGDERALADLLSSPLPCPADSSLAPFAAGRVADRYLALCTGREALPRTTDQEGVR